MHVLIVSPDTIGEKMAGPGIRFYEIARVLRRTFFVSVVAPNKNMPPSRDSLRFFSPNNDNEVYELYKKCDAVFCQGFVTTKYPFLLNGEKPLIIDLYDPIHIEVLTKNAFSRQHYRSYEAVQAMLVAQLQKGDFFICANERQRYFWLGMLSVVHRVNPATFCSDAALRNLIDLVPYGISSNPPVFNKHNLKGVYPGISMSDKLIVWGGGIWDWLDPLTPIKAISVLSKKRQDIKLLFLGTERPGSRPTRKTAMASKAFKLSKQLGLLDRLVFLNDGWVSYKDRGSLLLEADLGISAHINNLESHLSCRTRILDYIWAGLPIVCSGGDNMSRMVFKEQLGIVLHNSCQNCWADAIETLIQEPTLEAARKNVESMREQLTWELSVVPLVNFCKNPQKAADKKT